DGLSAGEFRATTTGPRTFDRVYNTSAGPLSSEAQQMASVTSLFYIINYLHDFWYDAGFTESAANAQTSNYGRGGSEGDAILAEAQDNANGGLRNNANMYTPSDGLPPRMQVYLWNGRNDVSLTAGPRTPAAATASFTPGNFDITAQLVLAADGTAPASDACEALSPAAVSGKIVLADRGACSFKKKALNIQSAGGVGMILVDNVASTSPPPMGDDAMTPNAITIGALSVTQADGATLKADVAAGPVTTRIYRRAGVELDGSLDSTLVAHEFGHYLHHRLSLCNTKLCRAMSEGWGDFTALLLMAREGDNLDGAYPFSVYTTQSMTSDPAYYGIRRAPYSTNTAINSLSFRHMADGVPLPSTHPFLGGGANSQIHNAGEVWASALWEVYVALQKAGTSFDETRKQMAKYVVAGLLLAPVDGTPTEIRDSILTAIHVASPADHEIAAAAFARRGFGTCAISPAAGSQDFVGVVESDKLAGRPVVGVNAQEAVASCDQDDILDPGESVKIRVPIANRGHHPLTAISATLSSTTPGITVVTQPAELASLAPYATGEVVAEVKLDGTLDAPQTGNFTLAITVAGGCEDQATSTFDVRLNVDDVAASSASDSFDTAASVWTPSTSVVPVWTHTRETALDGVWHGAALGARTDASVVSPTVTVGNAAFSVTFSHRH
ncbi:MAG TPA: M36 family metallopeptidase, partial [Kofleriaceae bacterium]|nr:M36 family metallopeptidase [Kofleriaceae bacterium]